MKPPVSALRLGLVIFLARSVFSEKEGEVDPIEVGDAVPFTPQVGNECPVAQPCRLEMGEAFGDPWVKSGAMDVKYFQVWDSLHKRGCSVGFLFCRSAVMQ